MKIAVIHHHLIQVPDTGPDNIPVFDAGDTLRTIIECKVRLVWEGIGIDLGDGTWVPRRLSMRGTLSERTRGFYVHSYNTIEVSRDNFDAKLKIVG